MIDSPIPTIPTSQPPQGAENVAPFVQPEPPPGPFDSSIVAPTIALPSDEGNGMPKWFYAVLAVTLIAFFTVTALVLFSLIAPSQPSGGPPVDTVTPTGTVSADQPLPVTPSLTLSPQASETATLQKSNEPAAMDAELQAEDFKDIEESLVNLE